MSKRPGAITVIAVLSIIGGVLGILAGFGLIALNAAAASDPTISSTISVPYAIIVIVLSIAQLVASIGLFQMKLWGYWGTIGLDVVSIALAVIGSSLGSSSVVTIIVVLYLLFGNVRSKFA